MRLPTFPSLLFLLLVPCVLSASEDGTEFAAKVRPILEKYCLECHGNTDDINGDADLSRLKSASDAAEEFDLLESAVEHIRKGTMPPEDHLQLSESEKLVVTDWFDQKFLEKIEAHPGFFAPRRLSVIEYRNTLHTLLGFELDVAIREAEQTVSERSLVVKLLPSDPPGPSGFTNDTSANPLTTHAWDQYSYLADNGLDRLFAESHRENLESQIGPIDEQGMYRKQGLQLVLSFAKRAQRRPLSDEQRKTIESRFAESSASSIREVVRLELKSILMSPSFLYRGLHCQASTSSAKGIVDVDAFELAERLSYFLWADMPDEKLFQLAESGELLDHAVLRQQVDRMLASPKARSLAEVLGTEWFSLAEIDQVSNNPPVARALRSQPTDFLDHLFRGDVPLLELIDSTTTFINPHTAKFYPKDRKQMVAYRKAKGIEIEAVPNQQITLTKTPERGGLLTMPGILAMNRGPVIRGTWMLDRILGERLPEPPPDVGEVPNNQGQESLTFRQRFELHRSKSSCAVCHDKIDPLGFALQEYDAKGNFQGARVKGGESKSDPPIDTSGRLPSGETFESFVELKQILSTTQRERVIRNIVERFLEYSLARRLTLQDRPVVDRMTNQLVASQGTYRELIYLIVESSPFRETEFRIASESE